MTTEYKTMTASAKIMYVVLMEKQQKSVEMGWIDEKDHVCHSLLGEIGDDATKQQYNNQK